MLKLYNGICNMLIRPICNQCLTSEECCICLDKITRDNKYVTGCKHTFHTDCIHKYANINATCPLCRTKLLLKRTPTSTEPVEIRVVIVNSSIAFIRLPQNSLQNSLQKLLRNDRLQCNKNLVYIFAMFALCAACEHTYLKNT